MEDFADEVTSKAKPEAAQEVSQTMQRVTKQFPDKISNVVAANGGFDSVVREGVADEDTFILRGAVTEYDVGNSALRLWVGFGAGGADFDARLELIAGSTGELLGKWLVNKYSCALGGVITASQTPDEFMLGAAKKIGEEISSKRKEGSIVKPGAQ